MENRKYIARMLIDNPGMEPTKVTLEIAAGGLHGATRRAAEFMDAIASYRGLVVNGDEENYCMLEVVEAPIPPIKSDLGDELAKRFKITQAAAQQLAVNLETLVASAPIGDNWRMEINSQVAMMHALGAISEEDKYMLYDLTLDILKISGHRDRREVLNEWRKGL